MGIFHFPKLLPFSKSLSLFSSVIIFQFFPLKKFLVLRLFSISFINSFLTWGLMNYLFFVSRNQEGSTFDFGELEEAIARQVRNDEAQARMLSPINF